MPSPLLHSRPNVRASAGLLIVLVAFVAPSRISASEEPSTVKAADWLKGYLSSDSSTIEGSRLSATYLRDLLHRAGVSTKWIVSPAGQPFLYARADAPQPDAKALVLLHHVDVVSPGSGWSHHAFDAEIENGALYGRGAIDDKSLGIAHLVAFLRFRQLASPTHALVFLAVGGEETGGSEGTGWLVETHPELFDDVLTVLTEGGTNRLYGQQIAWWGVEVAQKRPLWLEATATGRAGHGSSLNLHSAPHRLIRGLDKLVDRPLDFRLTPEARLFLESVAPLESPAFSSVISNLDSILAQPEPATGLLPGLPNLLLDTVQVNFLEAGTEINVTPDTAKARIDVRLLPDTDETAFLEDLRSLMGPEIELEILLSAPPAPPSPTDHEVFTCLETVLSTRAPVVPTFIAAITDARYLRQIGIPVYGFSPFRLETKVLRGIHASDEHIPLDAFAAGVETMWEVVSTCAGS